MVRQPYLLPDLSTLSPIDGSRLQAPIQGHTSAMAANQPEKFLVQQPVRIGVSLSRLSGCMDRSQVRQKDRMQLT